MQNTNANIEPLVYSVKDLTKLLNIGISQAYNLSHSKGFPVINIGRKKYIPKKGLHEWLEKNIV